MRKDHLPPLDPLRAFAVAAQELSFTRAAERLFVTQSAISKQIRSLEEHFGVPLFERRHRAMALTAHGATLLRATTDAFALLREAAGRIAEGEEAAINVTTTPALASLWLIPRLGAFFRDNPGIDVRISADTRIVDLKKGPYDIALRYLRDDEAPRGALRLFGETMLPVCSTKLLSDPARPLHTPDDLRFHTLLDYHDERRTRPWLGWPMLLEALGVAGLRPAATITFNHYDQLLRAAIDGHGVAVGSLGLLRDALADGRLRAPFAPRLTTPRGYYVLPAPAGLERPAVERFCEWLKSQADLDDGPAV